MSRIATWLSKKSKTQPRLHPTGDFEQTSVKGVPALKLKKNGIDEVADTQKVLGEGSFGKVYKATLKMPIVAPNGSTIPTGTIVAIKEQQLTENTNYDNMKREISALKTAMNGNCSDVNQIYDILYDSQKNMLYFILEFIEGVEVYELMQKNIDWLQSLSENDILNMFVKPLLRGLNCLHKNGIAHRDIKAENMMFDTKTRKAKWIDLGLSCIKECRGLVGTPETLAPEILHTNMNTDLKSWIKADYWSLGSSIYSMLTFKYYPLQRASTKAWQNKEHFTIPQSKIVDLNALDSNKYPKITALLTMLLQSQPVNRTIPNEILN